MQPPDSTSPPRHRLSAKRSGHVWLGLVACLLAVALAGGSITGAPRNLSPSLAPPIVALAAKPVLSPISLLASNSAIIAPKFALNGDEPQFGPNIRANSDGTVSGQHEPSIAVSPVHTNTVVVAAKDYRAGSKQVWIYSSTDGGVTWPASRQLQMPGIPSDLNSQSDPVVMSRDDGRIYVACIGLQEPDRNRGGIFITWSDDDGATWHSPSVPVFYPDNTLDDKDWFAVDNNPASAYYHSVYMLYAPDASNIVEQHSTDGGLTWSPRTQIGFGGTEYPSVVVGPGGVVYAFFMRDWGTAHIGNIQLTKSTDGGATWSAPSIVSQAYQPGSPITDADLFRFFSTISTAVDPTTGALYAAWTDQRNRYTDGIDVLYVKSADSGATWTAPMRLSHDPPGTIRDHITPMLKADSTGRLSALWLDRRLDPNNRLFDTWYTSTTDGGATWQPDVRVSTQSQDLNVAFPPDSGNAAGDYWGLDASGGAVYAAWNDTRAGNQDIYVARGLPTSRQFADVPATNAFYAFAQCLSCRGILSGYPCGGYAEPCDSARSPYFRPNSALTRGQLSKIVALSAGFVEPVPPETQTYADVPPDTTFWPYVERLTARDIVVGYPCGTAPDEPCDAGSRPYFRPNSTVTRGQAAKIVARSAAFNDTVPPMEQTFADVAPSSPFWLYIERLAARRLLGGYPCGTMPHEPCDMLNRPYFRPSATLSRGQAAKLDSLAFFPDCNVTRP